MILQGSTALKVLPSDARFLASLLSWTLGPVSAAGSRSWSSTCHTTGPTGPAQGSSHNQSVADNQQLTPATASSPAALKSLHHHSSCSSGHGSSSCGNHRKAQQRQRTQFRQQLHHGQQQQWRQHLKLDCWPEVLEKRDDKQIFRGGVVTPMEHTPLWHATFNGNVPSQWWPKESGSSSRASTSQQMAGNNACGRGSSAISSRSCAEMSSCSSDSDADYFQNAGMGKPVIGGSRNLNSSSSSTIPSWEAMITSSSSTISSLFRVSQPQPFMCDGELVCGKESVALIPTSPNAEFNRAARTRLLQQLRPLYPCSSSSIRIAHAERRARAAWRRQQREAKRTRQQLLDDTTGKLLQMCRQQIQSKVDGARLVSADWSCDWLVPLRGASPAQLLLKHRPSQSQVSVVVHPEGLQQQQVVQQMHLLHRRLAAQRRKQQRQQQFRLRSHSYAAAAAVVLHKETYHARKRLLQHHNVKQEEVRDWFGIRTHADLVTCNWWYLEDNTEVPRVSSGVQQEAAHFLATCGAVSRCTARRDEHGEVLPIPRHCIPGYCFSCKSDSSSSSSSSGSSQQQHCRQRGSQSACVSDLGCDATGRRGRKSSRRNMWPCRWWYAGLEKFRATHADSGQHCSNSAAGAHAWAATAATPAASATATATATAAEEVSTLLLTVGELGMQHEQYCSGPSGIHSVSGVVCDKCDSESDSGDSDWDSEGDSDYDCASDDDFSDDEADSLLSEEGQLSAEAGWAMDEPHVYRNHVGVIYGFWSKCPMG